MTAITQADSVAALIAAHGARRQVPPGSVVFREGDRGASVYAVIAGQIKLTAATNAGRDVLLGLKGPGDCFGELAALDGRARSATATVLVPSVLAGVDTATFLDLLVGQPRAALQLLQQLSAYLRTSNQRVSASVAESTVARAAHQLVDLATRHIEHGPTDGPIELTITQDDLAAWIGTTRESAARALARFRGARCVATSRGRITVTDLTTLYSFLNR
jgi:CRP-like cAMP-binding protein